jgi:hypothetical protein
MTLKVNKSPPKKKKKKEKWTNQTLEEAMDVIERRHIQ